MTNDSTAQRIQTVMSAGSTPTRKTQRSLPAAITQGARQASMQPTM